MRRAPRKDANHPAMVDALRAAGCGVIDMGGLADGIPDILVVRHPAYWLMEIKDGSKPPSARKLTPDQVEWHEAWKGPVHIVTSVDEALALVLPSPIS